MSSAAVVPSTGNSATPTLPATVSTPTLTSRTAWSNLGGQARRAALVGLGGQHAELVAPEPGDGVLGAHGPPQRAGDVAQQVIAGGVAEAVVELLEAVEVEHHQSKGLPGPPMAGDLVLGARQQRPPVGRAGHGV